MGQHVICFLTLIIGLIIFMNITIHRWPPIISIQDLPLNDVKKEISSYNSSMKFLQIVGIYFGCKIRQNLLSYPNLYNIP